MTTIRPRFTEDSWRREPRLKALVAALLRCTTEEDMGSFLRDIATLSELQDLGERLEVAVQLSKGLSYRQVARLTGASTTTVTRVAKFMENGEGGYRKLLNVHRHHQMRGKGQGERDKGQGTEDKKNSNSVEKPDSVLRKYLGR